MPTPAAIDPDVLRIQHIDAVPRILAAVARITGMRFAAVARVTDTRWMACAVQDDLAFGLEAGGELELESTICNEIRQHRQPVVFGHASQHAVYATHHTPLQYGLESYVSVPIFSRDGEFFGTLCAIDNRPAELDDPVILDSLQLFAELIGMQLELADDLDATRLRLRDAEFREQVLATTEREIRDLLLPVVTNLYLLRTSPNLPGEAGELVADMEADCDRLTRLLRGKLDIALGRIAREDA
ncbi:MAG TPA: GAF domain-containing protein [Thermomonas sp.]|nr:GAF domain-containing protein [Thermomonas sp.]